MNKYIVAVIISGLAIIPTVLYLRPESEPLVVIAVSTGFIIQIVTLLSSLTNKQELKETKAEVKKTAESVNGNLTKLLDAEKSLLLAQGQQEGRAEAATATKDLADELYNRQNPIK